MVAGNGGNHRDRVAKGKIDKPPTRARLPAAGIARNVMVAGANVKQRRRVSDWLRERAIRRWRPG